MPRVSQPAPPVACASPPGQGTWGTPLRAQRGCNGAPPSPHYSRTEAGPAVLLYAGPWDRPRARQDRAPVPQSPSPTGQGSCPRAQQHRAPGPDPEPGRTGLPAPSPRAPQDRAPGPEPRRTGLPWASSRTAWLQPSTHLLSVLHLARLQGATHSECSLQPYEWTSVLSPGPGARHRHPHCPGAGGSSVVAQGPVTTAPCMAVTSSGSF